MKLIIILTLSMRIICLQVLKWSDENSLFLASAYDLSFVGLYQRSFYKDTVNLGARTASNRTALGSSCAINLPEAQARCYITVQKNGIAFAAVTDDQYPGRVAFLILKKMSLEFANKYEAAQFSKTEKDEDLKWAKLDEFLKLFQDPMEVNKLEKLKHELQQVEEFWHKKLNDLMKQGKDVSELMEKYKEVSSINLDISTQKKKTNSRCCSLH